MEMAFYCTLSREITRIGSFYIYNFALIAPPFTGLDTLPALGIIIISLSIILDDALMLLAGVLVGTVGSVLVIGLGAAALEGLTRII